MQKIKGTAMKIEVKGPSDSVRQQAMHLPIIGFIFREL